MYCAEGRADPRHPPAGPRRIKRFISMHLSEPHGHTTEAEHRSRTRSLQPPLSPINSNQKPPSANSDPTSANQRRMARNHSGSFGSIWSAARVKWCQVSVYRGPGETHSRTVTNDTHTCERLSGHERCAGVNMMLSFLFVFCYCVGQAVTLQSVCHVTEWMQVPVFV